MKHKQKIHTMSNKKSKQLKTLTELPKDEYILMMRDLNPDLTVEELEDMYNESRSTRLASEDIFEDYEDDMMFEENY